MWWTGGALGFDLETDGKDPLDARIITCGMVNLDGAMHNEMELMLQPERDIPAEATAVHHITTEQAREGGAMREAGIAQIVATVAELAGPDRPLVGHNVAFDLTILDREMRRVGIGRLKTSPDGSGWVRMVVGDDDVADFPVIDTYVLDKAVDRYRPGKRQLSFVAAHYGVPMAEGAAHGATADVIACLRIAITIANRCAMPMSEVADLYSDRRYPMKVADSFCDLGGLTLAELHAAQIEWAAEQAVGLREHFLKKGDEEAAATVDGTWPFRPVPFMETIKTELV